MKDKGRQITCLDRIVSNSDSPPKGDLGLRLERGLGLRLERGLGLRLERDLGLRLERDLGLRLWI